jgi:hypothetical protein
MRVEGLFCVRLKLHMLKKLTAKAAKGGNAERHKVSLCYKITATAERQRKLFVEKFVTFGVTAYI